MRPEVAFLDEPTTGLDPRSRQSVWDLVGQFKSAGITTVLTTQYLEEADALSDRIIVIDHGTIIAEGTADELKRRTGSGSCEIVPQDPRELPAIADALGTLLPDDGRAALTSASDRIAFPAPDGVATVTEVLRRLDAAGIRFADVALRRPSLDDVFFALTKEATSREADRPDGRRDVMTTWTVARPKPSPLQQWWVLTIRVIAPTLKSGELLIAMSLSAVFTASLYLPLKQIMTTVVHGSYAQYVMPMIALQAVFFAAMSAALRSATDSVHGINLRFRAMPIAPMAPLAARMSGNVYRCATALATALLCGYVIGFRFYRSGVYTVASASWYCSSASCCRLWATSSGSSPRIRKRPLTFFCFPS